MNRIAKLITVTLTLFSNSFGEFLDYSVGVEVQNSTSNELVYHPNTNQKVSELIYKATNTKLLSLNGRYEIYPQYLLQIGVKTLIKEGNNVMDDYDWLKTSTNEWSHWSNHPNTKLSKDFNFDISLANNVYEKRNFSSAVSIGYFGSEKIFEVYDGSYIYSSANGFRDRVGTIEGLGVTYKEKILMPYVELESTIFNRIHGVNFTLRYSPFVTMENSDTHHLREFTDTGTHGKSSMIGGSIEYKYKIDRKTFLQTSYKYSSYKEARGDVKRRYFDGSESFYPKSSGMKSKDESFEFGLVFRY
jgi:outer membrane protease